MSKKNRCRQLCYQKYGNDIKFIRESGGIFYYEISTFWSGKFTIKVKDGFLGWSDEKL